MRRGLALIALLAAGCDRPSAKADYIPGGLYSVTDGKSFKVVKVLATGAAAVHVRLYKNRWPARPAQLDPATLQLGSISDKDGFGVGHLPLDRETFAGWEPVFLASTTLSPEELEGVLTK
jgi:hypothetical protein